VEASGGGTDTLDFSAVTADLTFSIHADGTIVVTDTHGNSVSAGHVENVIGGQGTNNYVFDNGATLAGTVTCPRDFHDTLDYSAYTTPIAVDLGANTATGTTGATGISNVIGGTSSSGDTLTGPSAGTGATWAISGAGTGQVQGIQFSGVEKLVSTNIGD